ncbi:nuclear transport factor 2 family protein [Gordonia terrae]
MTGTTQTSEGTETSLAARVDRLESRAAITKLMADYCHGIDKRDLELFSSVWHPDAVLGMGEGLGAHDGIDAIEHFVRDLVWVELLPESHHWTTNLSLDFDDADRARAVSDVLAAATDASGVRVTIAATYRDRFERRDGVWRFARRDSQIHYQLPVAEAIQS